MKQLLIIVITFFAISASAQTSTSSFRIQDANKQTLQAFMWQSKTNDALYFYDNERLLGVMPNDSTFILKDTSYVLRMALKGIYFTVHNQKIISQEEIDKK